MSAFTSALYVGHVVHTRLRPVRHRLRYPMMTMLLDLDELPRLAEASRLFSVDRFNLFSFHGADHLSGGGAALRAQIEARLAAAGVASDGGPIRVLCMPRVLGSVFNPLSVFFCHGPDERVRAVIYEVNNTFGERHAYLIPAQDGPILRQACEKRFFVSPFLDMAMHYRFRLSPPGERAGVAIEAHDAAGLVLSAAFAGRRLDLTSANLLRVYARFPLMAAQTLGAIHWEAAKLWRKGLRLRARPKPPAAPVTIVEMRPTL